MKRSDYQNNVWYPLTDKEYWVEEFPEEFPNCSTIVYNQKNRFDNDIKTYQSCSRGWGTMAKSEEYYFMIITKPMKPGIYSKSKDFIITEEELNELDNNEIIEKLKTLVITDNDDITLCEIFYVSQVECYSLLIINKNDNQNYEIMPIGINSNFDLLIGQHLIQIFREEFEDDVVVGINKNNRIEMFEWSFSPESQSDLDTLTNSFFNDKYEDFKEVYEDMKEMEIWNDSFKPTSL